MGGGGGKKTKTASFAKISDFFPPEVRQNIILEINELIRVTIMHGIFEGKRRVRQTDR